MPARKVGDLAKGTSLKVAVKKSFFKGVVTAEPLAIDDYVISQVELAPGRATVCLRKKVTEPDVLVLTLVDAGPSKLATVEHPGNVDAEALSPELDAQDTERLARLVAAVGDSLRGLHGQKERLVELRLDDKDAMGGALVIEIVERFVTLFAPTVAEIARRSPNDAELSLKREHDGGRREEVYLRKADLVDKLQPLWAHGRQVFAPLGLDGWGAQHDHGPSPGRRGRPPASIPPPPISAPAPGGPTLRGSSPRAERGCHKGFRNPLKSDKNRLGFEVYSETARRPRSESGARTRPAPPWRPPPRLTRASVCLVERPTRPSPYPRRNPARSMSPRPRTTS
jgi:hypothetical protein